MAGANFLSTVRHPPAPLLASARGSASASAVSSPARRHAHNQVCCHAAAQDEPLQFRRRDLIGGCLTTAIGLEIIEGSTGFTGVATAADLIERRQRSEFQSSIKTTLATAITAKKELIPSLLTLALNDAMTYDKATKSGGPNGSISLSAEISRPENRGLSAALDLIVDAKKEIDSYSKGGPISFSDLIQFAAQSALKLTFLDAAIAKCGGNEDKGRTLYSAYGSNGQWGLFDKLFGRQDAQEPDPEGRVPDWSKASVQEMKDKFVAIGLGPRQLAVMSVFLGPDQAATEERLIADKDCRPWVEKYQRSRDTVSRTDYEVDLITTLTKLSSLGQKINYEAYTYPKQKIDLGKLKL
ncbi:thylakoid lumenal 29 kDa protein, chloroplastic [Oryza brachyantha]|uniref:Thylakoid lumenal 29 kDa protein, chloroplastic n=1 Tax=Oryza brachyantha TaxID=4533 RepID=J3M133_ORYBR|nr:thylakoid lumenal 29 kDa protein, chloroplastic [Oryza brachyantha]